MNKDNWEVYSPTGKHFGYFGSPNAARLYIDTEKGGSNYLKIRKVKK